MKFKPGKVLAVLSIALMMSVSWVSIAHAEPITITLFGAAFASTLAGSMVSALIGAGVTWVASTAVNLIFGDKGKDKKDSGSAPKVTYGERQNRSGVFGTTPVDVHVVHMNEYNNAKVMQMVMVLADAKISALHKARVNGKLHNLTETATGSNHEHKRYTVNGFNGKIVLRLHDGRIGQAADDNLVAQSPGWDSTKKFSSMAYVVAEITSDKDLFNGNIPEIIPIPKGMVCYDPRLDSTRPGGSGSHRFATQSTWAYTENNAVMAYHYCRGFYYNGVKVLGIGYSDARLEFDTFIAAMNICDETVSRPDASTRPKYTCHLAFSDADQYGKNGRLGQADIELPHISDFLHTGDELYIGITQV